MKLIHNEKYCIGCRACVTACQDRHNLPAERKIMRIKDTNAFEGGRLAVRYRLNACRQCDAPLCMTVCPAGAISKDSRGAVVTDRDKCTACGACVKVCPVGAAVITAGAALRCTLCGECVRACPMGCISLQ